MTKTVVTNGVVQMPGLNVLLASLAVVLCSLPMLGSAQARKDAGISVSKERELREPIKVIDDERGCPENSDVLQPLKTDKVAANEYRFRFHNTSKAPIFVNLKYVEGVYSADYPDIEVLFRVANGDPWNTFAMNPGSFISVGLRRISLRPGAHIDFKAPVAQYATLNAKEAKLQLRFETASRRAASSSCVSSAPFVLRSR